jgi:DNA repair exonuclease SbcCD ATPase subunit
MVHKQLFPTIRSISISGGFMEGLKIDFAKGLNCIIGARGTGKTTIMEMLRYTLNGDAVLTDKAAENKLKSLISKNLPGGYITLQVETANGLKYRIKRGKDTESLIENAQGDQTTNVFHIAAYSQNEIESIADRPNSQLELVDSFKDVEISELTRQIKNVCHEINGLSKRMAQHQADIRSLEEEVKELPALDERLKTMTASGASAPEINKANHDKALRDREKYAVKSLEAGYRDIYYKLKALQGTINNLDDSILSHELESGSNAQIFREIKNSIDNASSKYESGIKSAMQAIGEANTELKSLAAKLEQTHSAQEIAYTQIMDKFKAHQTLSSERTVIEKRRNELLAQRQKKARLEHELKAFSNSYNEKTALFSKLRTDRFKKREEICAVLSSNLAKSDIRVTIMQDKNFSQYRDRINNIMRGQGLRSTAIEALCGSIIPSELVDIMRKPDAIQRISETANISSDSAKKIFTTLSNFEELEELATVELVDEPRIELKDGDTWKNSQELSTGQKCTTILPILLMQEGKPLVIDQPEDNLDNSYVSDKVVSAIEKVKARRQLIFVTHNPNIPVLGDAESVIVLKSDGAHGECVAAGNVDSCKEHIINLLEGGKEAFDKRAERYEGTR